MGATEDADVLRAHLAVTPQQMVNRLREAVEEHTPRPAHNERTAVILRAG